MRFSFAAAATAALALTSQTSALNILLGNDDGFASAQFTETYRLLTAAGHRVIGVSQADNESGQGGRAVFTNNRSLPVASEYNILPAGSPSFGRAPFNPNIFYYNGTPVASAAVGIDYVIPNFTNWTHIDLVVAGPNFGTNLGPFLWTLSGTAGYTYFSVGRGIPAIAFSGGNSEQRSYQWINQTTPSGYPDPATIQAQLAVNVVQTLVNNTPAGTPLLPQGYGLSVNTPTISSLTNASCVNPTFYQTRLTGGATYDQAVFNNNTGLFNYANVVPVGGGNTCINGDCSLPGETTILNMGCFASVSVFTVDYDAPN
ncbi:hypothetical protein BAUCODRAFT_83963, partial [Baudoinia panamericana UAMH 10762]